jgi:DNA-binding SARP family transcriptional activator/Tfp pilus assembly protein PilF
VAVGERLEFRILGPLEVVAGEHRLALTSLSQRALLAALLLRADQVVGIERLIDDLWAESPPRRAEVAVRMGVSRLRRLFGPEGPEVLLTRPGSYLLRVDPERVDARRFERLVGEGRAALAAGRVEEAAGLLREGLGLWRGPVLGELASMPMVMAEAARLDGVRLAALLARVEADEGLGRHAEALAELEELARSYPLDEGLHARLMGALARAGRQVEALEAFRDLRRRLVEELGVEPTPDLQRLERAILTGDPSLQGELGPPARPAAERGVVPAELPPDTASFTGRGEELARLERVVAAAGGSGPVLISAVDGGGGVGKSALAVHAAHRLAERFPDGQLYVNLQGSTPGLAPLRPLEALGRMLRSLGVDPAQVPTELAEAAALFRSELAGRRLLLVLDNARDTAQVAPLLPGVPGCGVLVTSRQVLTGLEGVTHLHLDVLTPEEAVTLLGRVAGAERIAAEPAAAAEIARCCGYLPLALRIAGARLAARPAWPVRVMAERLANEQRRLDELELAEVEVRASLAVSYRLLRQSPAETDRLAAEAFGLLGILDVPEFGAQVAARLLDRPERAVESLLERLVDAQLLESASAGRYRLHDLLRLYARELAVREHAEPVRAAMLSRVLGFYVGAAWRCVTLLRPGDRRPERADPRWAASGRHFADATGALDWLDTERANLLAAVRQAAADGVPSRLATQLAHALFAFFNVPSTWDDCVEVNQIALEVARRTGDREAQAQAHNDLGVAHQLMGRYDQAVACHQQSLAMLQELGDRGGEANSLTNLGNTFESQARYEQALDCHQRSLAIFEDLGDRYGQSNSLTNLGFVHERLGRYEQALDCHERTLVIDTELGDRYSQAVDHCNLGIIHQRQQRYDQALVHLRRSLTGFDDLGDPFGQATSLSNLGIVFRRLGRYQEAVDCLRRSLAVFEELGDRRGQAESLRELGMVHQRQQRHDQALDCLRRSLAVFEELGDRRGQAESLRELGVILRALGREDQARAQWRQALAICEELRIPEADEIRALLSSPPVEAPSK